MKAGKRRWRIAIERKTVVTDDYGGEVETWATWAGVNADVIFGSGSETRAAAQEQAVQIASFEVMSTEKTRAVTPLDRLSFDGAVWEIRGVQPLGRNKDVRITAVRKAA